MYTRMHALVLIACMVVGLSGSGCTAYRPDPPDLRKNEAEWRKLSSDILPRGRVLTWEALRSIGLYLNPDLNKARLKYLNSKHASVYAGLWNDPSVSADVGRYLKGVQYDRGISTGLSIPLSGTPGLARKVAQHYAETDYCDLRAQESDYMMRLHSLYFLIRILHTKHALITKRLAQAEEEHENIERLYLMGEVNAQDMHAATQRRNDVIKESQELESLHLDKHLELLSMLGLHPDVGHPEIAGELPQGVPEAVRIPDKDELLAHPRLLAAMSAFHTSEAELRLEIRKQYPDLEISPGFSHEEGDDKLTLGLGFTLPLWNRNREAIARASGNRAMSRLNAVEQWHELLRQTHALALRQELARKHCRTEFERLSALRSAMAQQEHLFSMGETTLPNLAETRHETFTRMLAYLDCLAELLEIQVALQYLALPNPS